MSASPRSSSRRRHQHRDAEEDPGRQTRRRFSASPTARYYKRSVAEGLDDYYAGRGESPGVWTGRGAVALGLEGVVQEGQLSALISISGLNPLTEERLRSHPRARTIKVERIDPHSGERRTEGRKLLPVAGFDLVFSPPNASVARYYGCWRKLSCLFEVSSGRSGAGPSEGLDAALREQRDIVTRWRRRAGKTATTSADDERNQGKSVRQSCASEHLKQWTCLGFGGLGSLDGSGAQSRMASGFA